MDEAVKNWDIERWANSPTHKALLPDADAVYLSTRDTIVEHIKSVPESTSDQVELDIEPASVTAQGDSLLVGLETEPTSLLSFIDATVSNTAPLEPGNECYSSSSEGWIIIVCSL
jgi:hypothetical protein